MKQLNGVFDSLFDVLWTSFLFSVSLLQMHAPCANQNDNAMIKMQYSRKINVGILTGKIVCAHGQLPNTHNWKSILWQQQIKYKKNWNHS